MGVEDRGVGPIHFQIVTAVGIADAETDARLARQRGLIHHILEVPVKRTLGSVAKAQIELLGVPEHPHLRSQHIFDLADPLEGPQHGKIADIVKLVVDVEAQIELSDVQTEVGRQLVQVVDRIAGVQVSAQVHFQVEGIHHQRFWQAVSRAPGEIVRHVSPRGHQPKGDGRLEVVVSGIDSCADGRFDQQFHIHGVAIDLIRGGIGKHRFHSSQGGHTRGPTTHGTGGKVVAAVILKHGVHVLRQGKVQAVCSLGAEGRSYQQQDQEAKVFHCISGSFYHNGLFAFFAHRDQLDGFLDQVLDGFQVILGGPG